MVSASFRYSDFHIYCTESNVPLAPRYVSEHSARINRLKRELGRFLRPARRALAPTASHCPGGNHWRPDMPATLSTIVRPAVTKRANPLSRLLSACWEGIALF